MAMNKEHTTILNIVKDSIGFTFSNILTFLKYWSLPFVASVIFYALTVGLASKLPGGMARSILESFLFIVNAGASIVAASFWVPKWVQFHSTQKKSPLFVYGAENKNYLMKMLFFTAGAFAFLIAISMLAALLNATSSVLKTIVSVVAILGFFYLCYRFCFVMPAAALGDKMTFMDSWHKSKKGSWKFLALILLLTFLINLPVILIGIFLTFLGQMHSGGLMSAFMFIGGLLVLATNIVFFGAFSIAWTSFYKRIR